MKLSVSPWLLIIVSIITAFSLANNGYLFWQNRKLQQQLVAIQKPTPTSSLAPSPNPASSWKTYTASTYTVKYPADFNAEQQTGSVLVLSKWGPTQKPQTEGYDGIFLTFMPREIGGTFYYPAQ